MKTDLGCIICGKTEWGHGETFVMETDSNRTYEVLYCESHKELIKALQQEILELREFYNAHCEVEKGLLSFDLHNEAVMRLRKAQEVLVKNDYEGR